MKRAVDLCAAPGSWSQVLAKKLNGVNAAECDESRKHGDIKIVAVDIQTMAPIDGVNLIQGDITNPETADKVLEQFRGDKADLVVCDGAPDVTGQHDLDEFVQSQLLLAALNITTLVMREGGTLVAKIFRNDDITLMMTQLKLFFREVTVVKPKSSRTSSIEAFIVCQMFKLPKNYKSSLFSLSTSTDEPWMVEVAEEGGITSSLIPFLMCGDLNGLGTR